MNTVENALDNFFADKDAAVFALIGDWGVGKTYLLNKYVEENKNKLKRKKYSYVSLFGLNTAVDIKREIFLNTVDTSYIGCKPDENTLLNNITPKIKKIAGFLNTVPLIKRIVPNEEDLLFFTLNDLVVCLDDLERAGRNLDVKEILGLASSLKEQKGAKVVILLNRHQQVSSDYEKYKEKVVDFEIEYKPSPTDNFDIIFDKSYECYEHIKERVVFLQIVNIRILKKIKYNLDVILKLTSGCHRLLKNDVVDSIVLYCYCNFMHYSNDDIPSREFILKTSSADFITSYYVNSGLAENSERVKDELQLKYEKWMEFLNGYGYKQTDDLNLMIFDGVVSGCFSLDNLSLLIQKRNQEFMQQDAAEEFSKAWEIFRSSFDDNEVEFVNALYDSAIKNVKNIGFSDFNQTVKRLKRLGRHDYAKLVIDLFFLERGHDPSLNGNIEEWDSDILSIISEKNKGAISASFSEACLNVVRSNYGDDDIDIVMRGSVSDYVVFLKSKNPECRMIDKVRGLSKFKNYVGRAAECQIIYHKLVDALKLIASECEINFLRVESFNIIPHNELLKSKELINVSKQ